MMTGEIKADFEISSDGDKKKPWSALPILNSPSNIFKKIIFKVEFIP